MTTTTPLLRVADIRAIEQRELARLPAGTLMQRAGAAAADIALHLLASISLDTTVVVLAGPGNNGGDALEVATVLLQAGRKVTVWQIAEIDPAAHDASAALARAQQAGVRFTATAPAPPWGLLIDGLFGIGLTRPLVDHFAEAVVLVNQFDGPVLALDVPSGLDADTGAKVGGPYAAAIRATHTVTFIADKPGLHTAAGADLAGTVTVAALGLEVAADALLGLNHPTLFASAAKPRPRDSNKGSFGEVSVIGGADGMIGAVLLAARAALF
ncbi:MAG: NAD(P)H-hydrate epimerase, partial [Pseudomonadota bacterium]|nr:NAD(P)H-hydrate epimerase [Pseudomonadota bacterium]